jgi:hypothetical protein
MRDEEFKELSYEELVQLTLKEAKQIEDTKKKRIIILAKKLENGGTPIDMISQRITRDLEGWVNSKYVRVCLGEVYKYAKLVREQSTSDRRASTPAIEQKNLLVSNKNRGKQDAATTVLSKEQAIHEQESRQQSDAIITIQSLEDRIRILEGEKDYLAKKLTEKSPEFRELHEEILELREIESKRIESDFKCAASLPPKNRSQQKITSLEKRISELETLLAKNRFEADLELKEQTIPLTILIDRVTGKAQAMVNTVKMKMFMS